MLESGEIPNTKHYGSPNVLIFMQISYIFVTEALLLFMFLLCYLLFSVYYVKSFSIQTVPFFSIYYGKPCQIVLYFSYCLPRESLSNWTVPFFLICRGIPCQIRLYFSFYLSFFAAGIIVKSYRTVAFFFIHCRISSRIVPYRYISALYLPRKSLSNRTALFFFFCLGNACQIVLYFSALYLSRELLSVNRYYKRIVSL
jgi:hypothetical protein